MPGTLAGTETVLLVEDQLDVRSVTRETLRRHGYTVVAAANGAEALGAARGHRGRIDLLVTDVVMPGMSGRDLAKQVIHERPTARVLYMSGYTDDNVVQRGIVEGGIAFIQKPYTPTALLQRIREVLNHSDARDRNGLVEPAT